MAGKPDLSGGPGVQNVVVYVSNDNFAQAYTVNHHAPPPPQQPSQRQQHHHHQQPQPPPPTHHNHVAAPPPQQAAPADEQQHVVQLQVQAHSGHHPHGHHHQQQHQQPQQIPLSMGYAPTTKIYADKLLQHQQQQQQQQQMHHQQLQHLQLQQQQQQQQLLDSQFNNHRPAAALPPVATGASSAPAAYYTNQAVIAHPAHHHVNNGYADHHHHNHHVEDKFSVGAPPLKEEYHHAPQQELPPEAGGYVVISGGGGDVVSVPQRSCDSVRSDAAESSCSSLSSEDVLVIRGHHTGGGSGGGSSSEPTNVLVYDGGAGAGGAGGVNVRHGVVVAVGGGGGGGSGGHIAAAQLPPHVLPPQPSIPVPYGWKRIVSNGNVVYISPSNTALSSLEHVKDYLLTPETCKCGLECPLKCDLVFNFDPKVAGKSWTFIPDTTNGDLTKLCNHKRKYIQQMKDCNPLMASKKKKRKLSAPYAAVTTATPAAAAVAASGGVSVSSQKINSKVGHSQPLHIFQQQPPPQSVPQQPQQFITKDNVYQQQQPSNASTQQVQRYLTSQGVLNQQVFYQTPPTPDGSQSDGGAQLMVPNLPLSNNISHSQPPPPPPQHPAQPMRHLVGSNGQVLIPAGNLVAAGQQQRVFINGQPAEPSGPGRPVMIPVSIATAPPQVKPEKVPNFVQHGQVYQGIPPQTVRHIVPNGFRPQIQFQQPTHHQLQLQQHQPGQQQSQSHRVWNKVPVHTPSPNNGSAQPLVNHLQNAYDQRVPPLHQHQPHAINAQLVPGQPTQVQIQVWPEEVQRKKVKTKVKKRYVEQASPNSMSHNSRTVQVATESSSPSFLDDPSGYLAQQTALLNSTINRQTGVNSFMCNSPQSSSQSATPPAPGVPLPSNIKPYRSSNIGIVKNSSADSGSGTAKCSNCDHRSSPVTSINGRASSRGSSHPGTPDLVTSSNYMEKPSPDSRPIQGGTVSTSNVSPVAVEGNESPSQDTYYVEQPQHQAQQHIQFTGMPNGRGVVTTMASGRTVGSNTITSVLAGKANTATVSISNPPVLGQSQAQPQQSGSSRSPLEMVQSIVSSIKLPHSQNSTISLQGLQPQVVPKGLPPGHILVSSGGQLIMATTNNQQPQQAQQQMPPPPPKLQTSMPPMSVSPMITNVTASVTQMIPAVAQQVLGQQTVLVNALPGPFVLQPGVTMTMDGVNQLQLQPQLVAGNVIQQQLQPNLLSPEKSKKGKKRKVSTPAVASMLQIAAQQNPGVVGFPQQIQMHSPQGLATAPVMQALTIVPGKAGSAPQFVMNGQMPNTAQIINSQSQPINLLQPVNLAQGMVQNFPTIQQFVLPTNLAGMVMNADGTATIVQDTNIGMQLQLQNVNGQNVLTPIQTNNQMFTVGSTNGQGLLPSGMVIRPQGKIIQQQHSPGAQFLSPTSGGQFVAQFNGQLSPLVASVSPGQQVTFSPQIRPTAVQQSIQQPEYITCGQTLMVPANLAAASQAASNQQNTTFVQQNTTIVQQQTTMLSNQGNNASQNHTQTSTAPHMHNSNQNIQPNMESFMISADKQSVQTVLVQQRQGLEQQQVNYRNSVSTQTAVNGHANSVTTFCQTSTSSVSAGSPPDTTTLSPLAPGGQSPPTVDTTTHSGSTDDGLSPAPSNCSSSMAMVHCITSSEPDSAEMVTADLDSTIWRNAAKIEYADVHLRKTTPTRVAYAESSTMMHYHPEGVNKRHDVVSSRNLEKQKRKHSDTLIVMETRNSHSLFDDDEHHDAEVDHLQKHVFVAGDLVWGPANGCPAWPGKLIAVTGHDMVTVRWFGGGERAFTDVDPAVLQTLTEGLEAHHRAGKKLRTGRKLNAQLEKAIQEAMTELDTVSNDEKLMPRPDHGKHGDSCQEMEKKKSEDKKKHGRLRSSRQTL